MAVSQRRMLLVSFTFMMEIFLINIIYKSHHRPHSEPQPHAARRPYLIQSITEDINWSLFSYRLLNESRRSLQTVKFLPDI